jgi:NitT/TauT family transport system substrate-binding protein
MSLHFGKAKMLAAVGAVAASLVGAAPAFAQTKLTIGSSVHSLFSLPLYLAETKGYFKDEGLQVEITNFRGGATATPALLGGSVQLQSAATENMLKVVQAGQPIVAVMTVQSTVNGAIIVPQRIVDKLGRVPKIEDLKGMKVGTLARGGLSDMAMRYISNQNKWSTTGDITLIPLGSQDNMGPAMRAGDLDAALMVEPTQSLLVEGQKDFHYVSDMLKGQGAEVFQDMGWVTLQGKPDWIEKNRATVEKVMRAMIKAQVFIADPKNLEEVIVLTGRSFPALSADVVRASVVKQVNTYAPAITPKMIEKNNELLITNGLLPAPIAYDRVVDKSFSALWDAFKR